MVPYLCELLAASQRNRPKCEKMKDVSSSRLALSARFSRRLNARACVTCARFYLGESQSLYIRSLLYEYRRERERERRARESVHRRRLCDQESARPNNFSTEDCRLERLYWEVEKRPQSSGIRYGKRLALLLQGFYLP